MEEKHEMIFSESAAERLDAFISSQLSYSRNKISRVIADGHCTVNHNIIIKPGYKLSSGDYVQIVFPYVQPHIDSLPQDIPLDIIYQDEHLLAVNKVAGMVVHPAAGNEEGTLVNALLYHVKNLSGINGVSRPGILHRLDKDTSGILLVAKNDESHTQISQQIQNRNIDKFYLAIVLGTMKEKSGKIIKPIARHKTDRKKMAITEDGKYAETLWQVLAEVNNTSLLLIKIITGRTHQIRVHFSSISRPVIGDIIYNKQEKLKNTRLLLHAYKICFEHPTTHERMELHADLPKDFLIDANKIGYSELFLEEVFNNIIYLI